MAEDPRFLPPPESPGRNLPVPGDMYRAGGYASDPEPEPPTLSLTHYFWIVKRHRWKIAGLSLIHI